MATEVLTIRLEDTGGPQTRESLDRTGKAVVKLGDRLSVAKVAAGNFIAEMAVRLVQGLGEFVTSTAASIDELGKFADQVGANIENLSAFRQVTALAGVDFDKFQKSLEIGTTNIQKAADGTGTAKRALEELRIPIQDIINLDSDEQFLAIAGAMESVESETRRLKLAQDIFGRGQGEVVRLLSQGEDALNDQLDAAKEMGAFFDEQATADVAALNDSIQILTDSFLTMGEVIITLIARPLTNLIQWITDAIRWISGIIASIRTWIKEFFGLGSQMEQTTRQLESAGHALIEYTGASEQATEATKTLSAAQEKTLETLEVPDSVLTQQYAVVNLLHDSATEALLAAEAAETLRIKEAQLAEQQRESARATMERANAITGLVAASASLAGIASPDQLGALLSIGGNLGTLFGASAEQLAGFGAAASVGAVGGALVGGRGAGAGIGGALGAGIGFLAGPIGAAVGSVLGGLIGGTFDSSRQPAVTFGTVPQGGFGTERGRIGQRTFLAPGELGNVIVGARDGGQLTEQLINFADLLSGLDDVIAGFVESNQSRLEAARTAAQAIANETAAENFRPEENIRIRFQAIFDSIGGIESALFDAFSPSGDFVPQVVAAIAVLRDLGQTSQTIATGFDETNDAFLQGIESLAIIEAIITQEDPIGTIRKQIEELGLTVEQQQSRQSQAVIELAEAYDGSIVATNEMASSLVSLEQVTAGVLQGIDAAQAATERVTGGTIERIRQTGLTPEQIFAENRRQAQDLRDLLSAGAFTSAESVQSTLSEINRLISSGFFGLSEEDRDTQRENQIAFLQNAQEEARKQFEAQERRAEEQHEAALAAANAQLAAAAATSGAAEALSSAAASLTNISEVI